MRAPAMGNVLLYDNVRWLSKGQMLKRVWGLREEVVLFLELMDTSEKRDHSLNLLRNPNQLARFSFLLSVNEIFKTSTDYINFWIELSKMNKFPYITEIAIEILTMFGSTWICESTFSAMTNINCKNRIAMQFNVDIMVSTLHDQKYLDTCETCTAIYHMEHMVSDHSSQQTAQNSQIGWSKELADFHLVTW
ncbi:hypothetical protein PR048_020848 [Dryococelus australis]|uniref:HAT C-terminal dimerisation domain-containing protein n=1 Tax=Dryococelus australis TaxID=614101 RepID=A0ABQ9GWJ2_9NEOP|nr:hypothetical protein PR048_020848 [Dryococelus australis]